MKKITNLTKKGSYKSAALIVMALFLSFSLSAQLVDVNGNIGIGTTTPAAKLQVNGAALFNGSGGFFPQVSGAGTRLMWLPGYSAFRAGSVDGTQWDSTNIGQNSVAFGASTKASGPYSTATGQNTLASGSGSTAMGYNNTASGFNSTALGQTTSALGDVSSAIGYYTTASSFAEVAVGSFNTIASSPTLNGWVATDRIFTIGNGTGLGSAIRSDAMVVLKNGNVGIGTSSPAAKLDVAGNMRLTNDIRFTNGNAMKGLVWGFSDFSSYTSRIDDYNGQLGIYTDDHFYLGGINTATGIPGDVKFYVNTVTGNTGIGTTAPSEKLDVAGNIRLNDNRLYLRGAGDNNHGIGFNAFNTDIDGPVVFGTSGGALGSTGGGNKTALIWNNDGNIAIGRTPIANTQLALHDIYTAGGKNLLVGDDAYLSDVDVVNIMGLYGNVDNTVGGIKLGSNGPVLWGQSGTLSIGTGPSTPVGTYKLFVEGGILTEKLKVAIKSSSDWADHVFAGNYQLMPLEQVAEYISKNQHLPGLPSAEKLVAEGGIDVNQMFAKQMEKIEELTLYVIDLNRKMAALSTENQQLKQNLSSSKK